MAEGGGELSIFFASFEVNIGEVVLRLVCDSEKYRQLFLLLYDINTKSRYIDAKSYVGCYVHVIIAF